MDYKLVAILSIFALIILFLYNMTKKLQKKVEKSIENIQRSQREMNKNILEQVSTNMTKCVSKIRELNNNNLHQMRRISFINQQPVTKLSNNFTETEDDLKTDMQYLSEEPPAQKDQDEVCAANQFYMSEDSDNQPDDESSIPMDINFPIYQSKAQPECKLEATEPCEKNLESETSDEDVNELPDEPVKNEPTVHESVPHEPVTNEPISEPISEPSEESVLPTNEERPDKILLQPETNGKIVFDGDTVKLEPDVPKKEKKRPSVSIKKDSPHVDLTIDNLKNVKNYNIKTLKGIAKSLSLPLTYKDDKKWRSYNKKQLYSNVKTYLKNK